MICVFDAAWIAIKLPTAELMLAPVRRDAPSASRLSASAVASFGTTVLRPANQRVCMALILAINALASSHSGRTCSLTNRTASGFVIAIDPPTLRNREIDQQTRDRLGDDL